MRAEPNQDACAQRGQARARHDVQRGEPADRRVARPLRLRLRRRRPAARREQPRQRAGDAAGAVVDAGDARRARAGERADVHPARARPRRLRRHRAAGEHRGRGGRRSSPACATRRRALAAGARCAARSTAARITFAKSADETPDAGDARVGGRRWRTREAILAVDGVDGCFVGPADLNISLGHSPDDVAGARRGHGSGHRDHRSRSPRRRARSPACTRSASTTRRSASRRAFAS